MSDRPRSRMELAGLRRTKVRGALEDIFSAAGKPLSAEMILVELERRCLRVNKTTVYRELARWAGAGLLSAVRLGDRKEYFELSEGEHHHHLVCLQCERVEDVSLDEAALRSAEKQAVQSSNFLVMRHALEFFGICNECSA